MIYPDSLGAFSDDALLARHAATPKNEYVDLLFVTGGGDNVLKIRRAEILVKLEEIQVGIASCKALSKEEDNVVRIDAASLIRMTLAAAKLAPKITKLAVAKTEFTNLMSNFPEEALSHVLLNPYKFQGMPKQIEDVYNELLTTSIKRWEKGLRSVVDNLTKVLPEGWRLNCVDNANETWIKENIITPAFVQGVGADYSHAKRWLDSVEEFQSIKERFECLFPGCLQEASTLVADAKIVVSLMLVYNTIYTKLPQCGSKEEKKQQIKDLKKKITPPQKKGSTEPPACLVPEIVMQRLTAAGNK